MEKIKGKKNVFCSRIIMEVFEKSLFPVVVDIARCDVLNEVYGFLSSAKCL